MTWYRESFGKDYLEVYAHRTDRQGALESDAILRMLSLEPGMRVLDVGCGTGRHSVSLREAGLRLTGVDLSLDLLRNGRARLSGGNDLFVRGDMRHLPFAPAFDAAVSLFTSFGYFSDESEDRRVLSQIRDVLRPAGRFLLDFLNADRVVRTLVPNSESIRDGFRIIEERSISPDGRRVEKTIRVRGLEGPEETDLDEAGPSGKGLDETAPGEKTFLESVRLYDKESLVHMLETAGFAIEGVYGSFAADAYGPDSPRTILTARRVD